MWGIKGLFRTPLEITSVELGQVFSACMLPCKAKIHLVQLADTAFCFCRAVMGHARFTIDEVWVWNIYGLNWSFLILISDLLQLVPWSAWPMRHIALKAISIISLCPICDARRGDEVSYHKVGSDKVETQPANRRCWPSVGIMAGHLVWRSALVQYLYS